MLCHPKTKLTLGELFLNFLLKKESAWYVHAAYCNHNALMLFIYRYLIKFFALVAEHHDVNKMTPSNLAVVLGPNLLWSSIDDIA